MIAWSEPDDPTSFSPRPRRIAGATFLTAVPEGWNTSFMPDGRLMAAHPDNQPRLFDPVTRKWSEFNGVGFLEMDPQPTQ